MPTGAATPGTSAGTSSKSGLTSSRAWLFSVAWRFPSTEIMAKTPTATQTEIIRAAVALASKASVDHLLYVGDLPLPEDVFRGHGRARKKLAQAVVGPSQRELIEAKGVPVLPLPEYDLGRPEKL